MSRPLLLDPIARACPRRSLDFQERVGRPRWSGPGRPPCVLLLTRAADEDADELSLRMAARGVPVVRLDADRVEGRRVGWHPDDGSLDLDDQRWRPVVVWNRLFHASAAPPADATPIASGHLRDQWSAWPASFADGPDRRLVNDGPQLGRVQQLRDARRLGWHVPPTVVTTDVPSAVRALDAEAVVVKAAGCHHVEAGAGLTMGLHPRRMTRAVALSVGVEPAPVLVQPAIDAPRELRVQLVGRERFAFAVRADDPASLFEPDATLEVERVELDRRLGAAIDRLVDAWSLDVAAIDLLDHPDGPVFLEVNLDGSWRWIERLLGIEVVSEAAVAWLEQRFEDGAGR